MKNGPVTVYDRDGNIIRGHTDIPPQYLKGWVEFYKLKFKVTPDVLIPRPETELLVDEVLAFIGSDPKNEAAQPKNAQGRTLILDIGTGSGNIAISIAKNLPNNQKTNIFATDISEKALKVAEENAKKNNVDRSIFFIKSNLLDSITSLQDNNLIIVTNLPYIPTSRINNLDPSVKDFEPRIALDGGQDGFDLYRKLFQQINEKFLDKSRGSKLSNPRGWIRSNTGNIKLIVCEIDDTQEKIAAQEAKKYFPKAKVEVKKDLSKKPRILIVKQSF